MNVVLTRPAWVILLTLVGRFSSFMAEAPELGVDLAAAAAQRVPSSFSGVHDLAQGFLPAHLQAFEASTPGVDPTHLVVRAIIGSAAFNDSQSAVTQVPSLALRVCCLLLTRSLLDLCTRLSTLWQGQQCLFRALAQVLSAVNSL